MLRSPRIVAWVVALTAVSTVGGLTVSASPAAAAISVDLSYLCDTASGDRPIAVSVSGAAPSRGKIGSPIRLGEMSVELVIPDSVTGDIIERTSASAPAPSSSRDGQRDEGLASGTVSLGVSVVQNGAAADAAWPAFKVKEEENQVKEGGIRLSGSSRVPDVTPGGAGDVAWIASNLRVAITRNAKGTAKPIECKLDGEGVFAVVGVSDPSSGTTNSLARPEGRSSVGPDPRITSSTAPQDALPCDEIASTGLNNDPDLTPDPPLYDETQVTPPSLRFTGQCALMSGFTNVKKQHGAATLAGDSLLKNKVIRGRGLGGRSGYTYNVGYAEALTQPSTATLLGFGFLPTKAVTTTEQVATEAPDGSTSHMANYAHHTYSERGHFAIDLPSFVHAKSYVEVRVRNVTANGAAVDVGSNCKAEPVLVDVTGYYGTLRTGIRILEEGGRLSSPNVTIPAFKNCGVGEDLSPLLTATTSGPGNGVRIDQAGWCQFGNPRHNCFGQILPSTWTVSRDGIVKAVAEPFTMQSVKGLEGRYEQIRCDRAELTLEFPEKGPHQSGLGLGQTNGLEFENCKRFDVDGTPTLVEVTTYGFPGVFDATSYDDSQDSAKVAVSGFFIESKDLDNTECIIRFGYNDDRNKEDFPARITGEFANKSQQFVPNSSIPNLMVAPKSPCETFGFNNRDGPARTHGQFELSPPTIRITSP